MTWKRFHPSKYLKADDLSKWKTPIGTIESAGPEMVGSGADAAEKLVVRFHEEAKGLIINITNGTMIEGIVGSDDEAKWVGARVMLITEVIVFKGQTHNVIRVRPVPPKAAKRTSTTPKAPAPLTAGPEVQYPPEWDEIPVGDEVEG